MINDIDIFNINMKLNIFYEGNNVLFIFKNYNNFKIRVIEIKKLIKKKI